MIWDKSWFTAGKLNKSSDFINERPKSIIIGAKSNTQKRVGIFCLTVLYMGPKTSVINLGLNRIPASVSQERMISNITR